MSPLFIALLLPVVAAVALSRGAPLKLASTPVALANVLLILGVMLSRGFVSPEVVSHVGSIAMLQSPALNLSVGVDGLSLLMALLTVVVSVCACWQIDNKREGARAEHIVAHLISAGALGAFVCRDLLMLYAFHELALIPTLLIIALQGRGESANRLRVAWKATVYLGVGSLILLAGLCWLMVSLTPEGAALVTDLDSLLKLAKEHPLPALKQAQIGLVLLVGFGTLVSLFPFHTWAAPAYATAPVSTAMLHSGVLKKFGIYGLLRVLPGMLPLALSQAWLQEALCWALLGNILWVGWVCIHQRNLDEMLAHSSVMHMGYLFLGLAAGGAVALEGVALLAFAHGISIALLFALAGRMRAQLGTLEFRRLGGLGSHSPALYVLFCFGMFASIGLPGLANFAGELMIFVGCFGHPGATALGMVQWTAIAALWGVVMSAVYGLRALRALFQGTSGSGLFLSDPPLAQRGGLVLLASLLLVAGTCPWLPLRLIAPAPKDKPAAGAVAPKAH